MQLYLIKIYRWQQKYIDDSKGNKSAEQRILKHAFFSWIISLLKLSFFKETDFLIETETFQWQFYLEFSKNRDCRIERKTTSKQTNKKMSKTFRYDLYHSYFHFVWYKTKAELGFSSTRMKTSVKIPDF